MGRKRNRVYIRTVTRIEFLIDNGPFFMLGLFSNHGCIKGITS